MKRGRGATMTHDYKRNGPATLFAALNILDGTVMGTCMERHRHQEWLKFLRLIDSITPAGKQIHLICDNYSTHNMKRCSGGSASTHAIMSTSHLPAQAGS